MRGPALVALVVAVALPGASCSRTSEAAPAPSRGNAAPAPAAAAKAEGDGWSVVLAPGACRKGATCAADVVLVAKGDYHVNDRYPTKFTCQNPPPDGLVWTKPVVTKEDGAFEHKKATLPVRYTVSKAGEVKVGGTFAFSVCTEKNCLMEKQALEVTAKVE